MGYETSTFTGSSRDPNIIFWAQGTRGLFQSSDNGVTWEPLTPPHMCIQSLKRFVTPQVADADVWCVAGDLAAVDATLVCSRDQGNAFDYSPFNIAEGQRVEKLIADATNPANMVARTWPNMGEAKLWRTYDGGLRWQPWKVDGTEARDVELLGLRPDGVVRAEICGQRPGGELCATAKLSADAAARVTYLDGPWTARDEPRISGDPLRAGHWLAAIYVQSSRTMYLLETFDDGATFARIKSTVVSLFGDVEFFRDGGLAYVGMDISTENLFLMVRHGDSGDLQRIAIPAGYEPSGLQTAGNLAILRTEPMTDHVLSSGLFRLDESRGTANATWQPLDGEKSR